MGMRAQHPLQKVAPPLLCTDLKSRFVKREQWGLRTQLALTPLHLHKHTKGYGFFLTKCGSRDPRLSTHLAAPRNHQQVWIQRIQLLCCTTTAALHTPRAKRGLCCTQLINLSMGRISCGDLGARTVSSQSQHCNSCERNGSAPIQSVPAETVTFKPAFAAAGDYQMLYFKGWIFFVLLFNS